MKAEACAKHGSKMDRLIAFHGIARFVTLGFDPIPAPHSPFVIARTLTNIHTASRASTVCVMVNASPANAASPVGRRFVVLEVESMLTRRWIDGLFEEGVRRSMSGDVRWTCEGGRSLGGPVCGKRNSQQLANLRVCFRRRTYAAPSPRSRLLLTSHRSAPQYYRRSGRPRRPRWPRETRRGSCRLCCS